MFPKYQATSSKWAIATLKSTECSLSGVQIHWLFLRWTAKSGLWQAKSTKYCSVRYKNLQNVSFIDGKNPRKFHDKIRGTFLRWMAKSADCFRIWLAESLDCSSVGTKDLTGLCICLKCDRLWLAALSSLTRFSSCCSESLHLAVTYLANNIRISKWLAAALSSIKVLKLLPLYDWLIISELSYD